MVVNLGLRELLLNFMGVEGVFVHRFEVFLVCQSILNSDLEALVWRLSLELI